MKNEYLILIVEDDERINNFISAILTSNNYKWIKTERKGSHLNGGFPLPGFDFA